MKSIKKSFMTVLAAALLFAALCVPAMALDDIALPSKSAASDVTIGGTAAADQWVSVKITYNNTEIVFFDGVKAGADGKYAVHANLSDCTFPLDVTVTYGYSVETAKITMQNSGGGTGGGGGGGTVTAGEEVKVTPSTGGTTTVNPDKASAGDTVKIVTKPDSGNVVDSVKVTDKNGNTVTVKDNGDGSYSFTMPKTAVDVSVTYKPAANGKFTDVADNAWYHDAVYFVADNGYFKGTANNLFSPDDQMTRAMFVTVIGRLAGVDASQYQTADFTDVQAGTWYAPYVAWAAEKGIVKGISAAEFDPNGKITREQMAAMMYRYAEFSGVDLKNVSDTAFAAFADKGSVSAYAKDAMIWAADKGVINGTEKGLEPAADATRAQVAQIIKNYVEKIK